MNSVNVNLYSYYSKFINLHSYTVIDIGHFLAKMYKFYTFFYYYHIQTDLSALTN